MPDLAVYLDGLLLGGSCRVQVIQAGNKIRLQGEVSPKGETFSLLWRQLDLPQDLQLALNTALQPPSGSKLCFSFEGGQTVLTLQSAGLCLTVIRDTGILVIASLQREQLAGSEQPLFRGVYEAARFLCLDALYFRYSGEPTRGNGSMLPAVFREPMPSMVEQSDVAFVGKWVFAGSDSVLAQGIQALLGIEEMLFVAAKQGKTFAAGLYLDHLCAGKVTVDALFLEVGNQRVAASGTLRIGQFGFVLGGSMGAGAFSLEGALAPGTVVELGHGWVVTELALAIGYQRGIAISLLGRITARELMLFAALRVSLLPGAADLQLLSAASSEVTLPALVESVADAQIPGLETFDFIGIESFSLLGTPCLTREELAGDREALLQGVARALAPTGLAPQGEVRASPFGNGWMVTDAQRMRHYPVAEDGRVQLNPQFYYAAADQPPLGGYEIHAGTFFCGVVACSVPKSSCFSRGMRTGSWHI